MQPSTSRPSNGRRSVLLAILVFDGRDFVPQCIQSAAGLRSGRHQVDVVVLDDCSPEPGWSDELRALCESLDVGYYRSPRNLGIPKNMSLALQRAMSAEYDYALIVNSDTVLPLNLVTGMVAVAESATDIGSVTAWSNNVSVFSAGSNHPALREQDMVDWVSGKLHDELGDVAVDLPTAVGFCMLVPVPVARRVGLFDPIFGRGYCEEVDWARRSIELGYRAVLAPSVFVFHLGGASTRAAGILTANQTTLGAHEAILDLRYATYREDVDRFMRADVLPTLRARAGRAIVHAGARRWGYRIEVTELVRPIPGVAVRFHMDPEAVDTRLKGEVAGFLAEVTLTSGDVVAELVTKLGRPPSSVLILDRGPNSDRMATAGWGPDVVVEDQCVYPQRV